MCDNTKTTRDYVTPPTPHWALLDLEAVGKALEAFTTLPCPARATPNSLSRWFDISSTRLTSLLTSHAPSKRPCHEDYTPLTSEEVSRALSKSSNTSAPSPDHIPYSVWKLVHRIKPSLLSSLLDPLLAHGFHPPCLKKALGIVLDKPGKPSYDSPSSFRVILLLRTLSKILERVAASRLTAQAVICSLIHPLQCGSLPGRSTTDAALVLQHNVESFHRLRYKVSTLFLDVKGGFDNVESLSLLSLLRRKGVSPYVTNRD